MDARIDKLEEELAYARRGLEDLNEVVVEQSERIASLEAEVRRLEKLVREIDQSRPAGSGGEEREPPPPHY